MAGRGRPMEKCALECCYGLNVLVWLVGVCVVVWVNGRLPNEGYRNSCQNELQGVGWLEC